MFAALLTAACLAPVPGPHLAPPADPRASAPVPNNPTVPGFRWFFGEYELEVVGVVETGGAPDVIYRCVSHPGKVWGGCGAGLSRQSLAATWREASDYPPRPPVVPGVYRPFTMTWED